MRFQPRLEDEQKSCAILVYYLLPSPLVPERKLPIFPISASGASFNPQNTQCIPAVKICVFLELEKIF